MTSTSELRKAMRGTKRVCQACAIRFYDLSRTTIVCPSCGEQYVPVTQPTVEGMPRTAPFAVGSGWHRRDVKRAHSTQPATDTESTPSSFATVPVEETTEEKASPMLEDEALIESEADDPDISNLIEHDAEDTNEH